MMSFKKSNLPGLFDGSLHHLVKSIDSFFGESFKYLDTFIHHNMLFSVDSYETDSDIIIEADLPGYERAQIQVEILGDRLRISAESSGTIEEHDDKKAYFHKKQTLQRMEKFITLPFLISEKETRATYKNGLLRIITPKQYHCKRLLNIE
ncbi:MULTISPECIES: Hsp20/alpha crystallin family protein [Bacillaceae]|uniref:Hsp20/alpha crystallin family protein n=1 Tax=Bacillaceae TaxID=186817 RepID=UPI000E732C37|nr:Hsp20/alpha crystallin family protein [Bacillus sp. PK3_68]RJS59890.1 hypothetical protein CJ483_07230 [Bacillus sp. PK3_68]